MKTKKSIKNVFSSVLVNVVSIFVGLIAQALFLKILGVKYLGINGLFSNIISILGIVELGIGNAIIYNLYKPLVNKDYSTINSLMKFYKNAYHIIALIVFILSILIMPFLPFFINDVNIHINIYAVYIFFILDIVCSYLLSYKRSILYADQSNYVINIIHMCYYILLNFFQLLLLYLTKNYYLYLIIKVIMRVLENIVITIYVNKKYTFLNEKKAVPLNDNIKVDIKKKVKALFFHKIGGFIVSGTDNIIISKYIGLVFVGLYSNYYIIIDALNKLFGQAITAITPSVGHMLVSDDKKKQFSVFKKIRFANFCIATFSATSLLVLMQPFIRLWVGKEFLLSNATLFVLTFNYFQKMMRNSYMSFKEAVGIFYEDRFVPLIESSLNIIFSIILAKLIGMPGVFLGTIISGLTLWLYSYPRFIYKGLFNRSYFNYFLETFGYILLFVLISVLTYYISTRIIIHNSILMLFVYAIICLIIPFCLIILLFRKTDMFNYYFSLFKRIISKTKKSK